MAILFLNFSQAVLSKSLFSTAALPIITLSTPLFIQLSTSLIVLIPPPIWIFNLKFFIISFIIFELDDFPLRAPSKSTIWIFLNPLSKYIFAWSKGVFF